MPYAPRATLDNPYGPQITFRTEDVLPPSAYYISPEDQVTVWVVTDVLAQTIYIQLRMLMPTGEIKLIPYNFAPQFIRNWYPAFELPPWEGHLLGAVCYSTNPQRGQCFVSVQVMRSSPPNLIPAGMVLMQGYISAQNVLSYPTSPLEPAFSGRGAFLTMTYGNLTGQNLNFTVMPNTLWRVCSLTFWLYTDATPGNRTVTIVAYDVNNTELGFWNSTFAQPPSTNYQYSFSCGGANAQAGLLNTIAGPTDLFLQGQAYLQSFVAGLSATDQIRSGAMLVEEWMGA